MMLLVVFFVNDFNINCDVENFFVGDCGSMWGKVYTFTLNLISDIDYR
jgi:hypothetical protein